jgi:hypothetical protein
MARLISVAKAVSDASLEIGIVQAPVLQAVGSRDQDVAQMVALLSAVADEVLDADPYEQRLGDGMWLRTPATNALSDQPTADDQEILFDGRLAIAGLKFRFLQAKGLEYGEQLRDFTMRLNKLATRANRKVLDLYDESDGGRVQ